MDVKNPQAGTPIQLLTTAQSEWGQNYPWQLVETPTLALTYVADA